MDTQPRFEFARDELLTTTSPIVAYAAPAAAQRRLSAQCARILARLRQGPATNRELAAIALKYTGRLSDLRAAGHAVTKFDLNHATGECWYRLEE